MAHHYHGAIQKCNNITMTWISRFYASLTIFLLTSPKKCGIFVKKSRIIQTVEAEIKAVDAPTESSGWWDPGGDADCQMDR